MDERQSVNFTAMTATVVSTYAVDVNESYPAHRLFKVMLEIYQYLFVG